MTLPKHIMNYRVSSKSPSGELMTLGRLLSEVGDYASTTIDSKHIRLAKSCRDRLEKVLFQLIKRDVIEKKENLFELSSKEKQLLSNPDFQNSTASQLQTMSISELELLYRFRQGYDKSIDRINPGLMSGLYARYEIVVELEKREPVEMSEQLKTDYCTLTFRDELDYSSFLINAPIGEPSEYIPMDRTCTYSPDELIALIHSYSGYWRFKTVFQKLMLEQYVEYAISYVDKCLNILSVAPLIAAIAHENSSLSYSYTLWVNRKLKEVVGQWEQNPSLSDSYMVPVLYAMHHISKGRKYEIKARKLLSAAYKSSLISQGSIDKDIDYICTVAENLNMTYNYSIRKLLKRWTEVCRNAITSDLSLSCSQLVRLLSAAKEIGYYEPFPTDIVDSLRSRLSVLADKGDIVALTFLRSNESTATDTSSTLNYEPQYAPVSFDTLAI